MFSNNENQPINTRLKSDLPLLLAALIWGSTFVVQRMVAANVSVFLFNGIRFLLAALVILPFFIGKQRIPRKYYTGVALTGILLSAGAAFQQAGLRETTAANAGFITSLYVVVVPILLAVFWKQRASWLTWVAALISAAGAWLLSAGGGVALNRGDLLELIGVIAWALQVIMVGKLSRRMNILPFAFGQFLVAGVLQTVLGLIIDGNQFQPLVENWWAVAFSGIFSVAVGFSLQAYGQRHARSADSAILLSMEAVFAALFGFLMLGEGMAPIQIMGCGLILGAVVLVQVKGAPVEKKIPETILRVIQEV